MFREDGRYEMVSFSESKFQILHFFDKEGRKVERYDDCHEVLTKPLSNVSSGVLIPMTKSLLDEALRGKSVFVGDVIVRTTNYELIQR
jgi:hypothetical protein